MDTREGLRKSMLEATKQRDQVKLDTLRMAISAFRYKEIENKNKAALTEDEVLRVLSGLCKQRRDSIEQFSKAGRQDLVDKETRELKILEEFLPRPMDRMELEQLVKKVVQELGASGAKDTGKVMKTLMPLVAGKADGKLVSELVKGLLG